MALTPRLDQRQSQSLVMTPQLQQAIKMLQLSNMELAEYIEQELETNITDDQFDPAAMDPNEIEEIDPDPKLDDDPGRPEVEDDDSLGPKR